MKYNLVLSILLLHTGLLHAQKTSWTFEYEGGVAYNLQTPLTIRQENEPTIRLNARYRSESLITPIYFAWRIGHWKNKNSWEFEFVHHKLFLDNKPPEVQKFEISHGYNMAMVNRAFKKLLFNKHEYILRLGAGVVLAHAESTVRGQSLDENQGLFSWGYYLTGPVINITVAKQIYISNWMFINTELKFNPSVSRVPIEQGHAIVWNVPFAFAFGLGIDINRAGDK